MYRDLEKKMVDKRVFYFIYFHLFRALKETKGCLEKMEGTLFRDKLVGKEIRARRECQECLDPKVTLEDQAWLDFQGCKEQKVLLEWWDFLDLR